MTALKIIVVMLNKLDNIVGWMIYSYLIYKFGLSDLCLKIKQLKINNTNYDSIV